MQDSLRYTPVISYALLQSFPELAMQVLVILRTLPILGQGNPVRCLASGIIFRGRC